MFHRPIYRSIELCVRFVPGLTLRLHASNKEGRQAVMLKQRRESALYWAKHGPLFTRTISDAVAVAEKARRSDPCP